jgi:hypothetical protein
MDLTTEQEDIVKAARELAEKVLADRPVSVGAG